MNYQSDFKILEGLKDGSSILSAPFRFTYYVKMDKGVYVAEYDGSEFTNCRPTNDGRVVVPFDHPRLGLGELMVKREFYLTDSDFKDGICNLVSVESTGITLDKGATEGGDVVVELFPYYQKGPKGDKMTYDDLTEEEKEDLAKKVIGDAEDKRRAAEIIRQQNEVKREQGEKNRTDAFEEAQDERRYAFNVELGEFADEFRQEEQGRQNVFSGNEIQRSLGEEKRVADETKREEAEALRASNEALRQEAEIVREANEKRREETYKSKVDRDDNAPKLTAGFANNLVGRGEATEETIGFRPSGGDTSIEDGTARIDRVKGNTMVWNQLIESMDRKDGYEGITTYYDGVTNEFVIKNLSRESNHISGSSRGRITPDITIKSGHVYYLYSDKDVDGLYISNSELTGYVIRPNTIYVGEKTFSNTIWILRLTNLFPFSEVCPVGSEFRFKMALYDLTQMFGAGNEPTTIEEFNSRKPINIDEYAYNEGELISTNVEEVKSVGFNAWDEEWENGTLTTTDGYNNNHITSQVRCKNYIKVLPNKQYVIRIPDSIGTDAIWIALYDQNKNIIRGYNGTGGSISGNIFSARKTHNIITTSPQTEYMRFYCTYPYGPTYMNDICLHLAHTGYRNGEYEPYKEFRRSIPISEIKDSEGNQLFPNGLLSAGNVCDEITATKAIKRIGVVDLGTLTWYYNSTAGYECFLSNPCSIVKPSANNVIANIVSSRFVPSSEDASYLHKNDNVIAVSKNSTIFIYSSAYTDPVTFKASLSGVMLYYELSEPIEVDLEEPINMDYEVSDFGTEEVISDVPTTPLKADIIYQFNAVDRIRDNSRHTAEAEVTLDNLQKGQLNLTVKDNGNIVLSNANGETKEFMPATPSGDPMHYAYIAAGAEWNDGEHIVKDTPWKADVDSVEYKAQWGIDIITGDVATLTYGGKNYEYVVDADGAWKIIARVGDKLVWDDTKVIHRSKHWYLNGLGDITDKQMKEINYSGRAVIVGGIPESVRTHYQFYGTYNLSIQNLYFAFQTSAEVIRHIGGTSFGVASNAFVDAIKLRVIYNWVFDGNIGTNCFDGSTKLQILKIKNLTSNVALGCPVISKICMLYLINNAKPTKAITITLHPDAYARLGEDADVLAALEAKNAELQDTGGSISLVSA